MKNEIVIHEPQIIAEKELQLEDVVCSLQWAKRLKEENVKQKSLYIWFYSVSEKRYKVVTKQETLTENYSAFTVPEFNLMFPKDYSLIRRKDDWLLRFTTQEGTLEVDLPSEPNICDVFAKMLLAMVKNKDRKMRIGKNFMPFDDNEDPQLAHNRRMKFIE